MEIQQLVERDLNAAYNSKEPPQRSVNIKFFIFEEKWCPCLPALLCKTDSGGNTFRKKQQLAVLEDMVPAWCWAKPLAAGALKGCVFHFALLLTDLGFWQTPMI